MSKTTRTTTKAVSTPGVTRMDSDKHNYDGFAVRRSKHNHAFLRYVGAAQRLHPLIKNKEGRFAFAKDNAALALSQLGTVIDDPKAWRTSDGKKTLVKKYALVIRDLGFKIKSPTA